MKIFLNLVLFSFLASCSSLRKKPSNITLKKIGSNKKQTKYYAKYIASGDKEFQSNKKLSRKEIEEDIDLFKFYVKNSHPYFYSKKKKEIEMFLSTIKYDSTLEISSDFEAFFKRKLADKPSLGIKVVNQKKEIFSNEFKALVNDGSVLFRKNNKDNFAIIKIKGDVLNIKQFNKNLIKAMDSKKGIVFDFSEYVGMQRSLGLMIRAHLYGIYLTKDYLPTAHEPLRIARRVYVRNWLTEIESLKKIVNNKQKYLTEQEFIKLKENLKKETKRASQTAENASLSIETYDLTKLKEATFMEQSRYKKPIVIITSNKCELLCEEFVSSLKPLPNVTIVGTKTKGNFEFEDFIKPKLLNSGIQLSIPYSQATYKSEFKVSMNGIKPDIYSKDRKRSYQTADKIIRENSNDEVLSITSKEMKLYFVRPYFLGTLIDYDLYINGKDKKNYIGKTNGNEHFEYKMKRAGVEVFQNAQSWSANIIDDKDPSEVYFAQPFKQGRWHGDATLIRIPKNTGRFYIKFIKGRPLDPNDESSSPNIFNPFQ